MSRRKNRLELLLAHQPRDGITIEVAPYFNPALPKAKGHDVLILDVFDTATLRANALKDSNIPTLRVEEIEEVDVVGDASQIGELVTARGLAGKIGYVVSSHNFEHLPDPIGFLRGVEKVLMPGGVLSMAIPDCRATFDHFRSLTRLVDWLAAYHDKHRQPTPDTVFDMLANCAGFPVGGSLVGTCDWRAADPREARPTGDLRGSYAQWLSARMEKQNYYDSHVSVVFDAQFELLIEDLRHLGLINLEIIDISQNNGHEFFAHLRRPEHAAPPHTPAEYGLRRAALMRLVAASLGDCAFPYLKRPLRSALQPKTFARMLFGHDLYGKMRAWNRARKARKQR